MKTIEWKRERRPWPPGPWHDEPDKRQWQDESTGLPCLIVRNNSGALCGYVGVPDTHPLHGKGYSDKVPRPARIMDREIGSTAKSPVAVLCAAWDLKDDGDTCRVETLFDCHGGLTFADACRPSDEPGRGICHEREPGDPEVWWFGFDCSHYEDLSPGYDWSFDGVYRNVEYVAGECRKLAKQIAAYADESSQGNKP